MLPVPRASLPLEPFPGRGGSEVQLAPGACQVAGPEGRPHVDDPGGHGRQVHQPLLPGGGGAGLGAGVAADQKAGGGDEPT